MRLAIVGSREYPDMRSVRRFVAALPHDTVVVSGGARGVDRVAAAEARSVGLEVVEHVPDWEAHGSPAAAFIRNSLIVEDCDEVVAFWDGESRGTMDTMKKARACGKPVRIVSS